MEPLKVVSSGSKQFSRQTPPAPSGTLSTKNLNVHPTIKGDPNDGLDELEPNRLIFPISAWDALHYIQCILYIVCNACTNTFILLNTTPDVSVDLSSMTASGDLLLVSQGDTKGWTAKEESPSEKKTVFFGKKDPNMGG